MKRFTMTIPRLHTVRRHRSLMVTALAAIGAGCGHHNPIDPKINDPIPTTIELSVGDSRLLVGNSLFLEAIVRDERGALMSVQVIWTSSEPHVVSVGASGVAMATSGGSASITATAQRAAQSVIIDVPEPVGTVPEGGGTLEDESSGVQVAFAAGAVSQEVAISIVAATANSLPASGMLIGGTAHEFGPTGLQFNKPVVLTIPFDPAMLPTGLSEARLAINKVVDGAWAVVGGSEVDQTANTVTAEITSFSIYGVLPVPNLSPTVLIESPPDGSTVFTGESVEFRGTATDPEDGTLEAAALEWISDLEGDLGTGNTVSASNLSLGSHVVTLIATDSDGASASASIQVEIVPNSFLTVAITTPNDGDSFKRGNTIAFAGSAHDMEDGNLTGEALTWASSLDGPLGTGVAFESSGLSVGDHVITLTATDSRGLTGTAAIRLTVQEPQREIRVQAGSSGSITLDVASQVDLPINVDMTNAGDLDIASIDVRVTWSAANLTFAGASSGNFGTSIINDTDASNGVVRAVVFNATGTSNSFVAFNLSLTGAAAIGSTTLMVEVLAAGDELGQDILGSVTAVDLTVSVQN